MSEAADEVGTEVAETVAPGSAETHSPSGSGSPSNADILARLDELAALITSTASSSTETATGNEAESVGEITEPGNGEVIRDNSPASKPWTHKRVLR